MLFRSLLVDDSRTIRALVKPMLTDMGFQVMEAGDGQQALDACNVQIPDVVLLDWNMPVMDGLSFLRELKTLPAYKFTPVIMLTTEDDSGRMAQAKAAGARAWLLKPFNPPALLDTVSKVITA